MSNYLIFDVETPNSRNDSICSISAILTDEQGRVLERLDSLVDPRAEFDSFNTSIHGVFRRDVLGKPTFDELWNEQLHRMLGESIAVAHGAQFDLSVLVKALRNFGLTPPAIPYFCTLKLAHRSLNLPKYSLPEVCSALGIDLFKHHDAAHDAEACKLILEKIRRIDESLLRFPELFDPFSVKLSDTVSPSTRSKAILKPATELAGIVAGIEADKKIYPSELNALKVWRSSFQHLDSHPEIRRLIDSIDSLLSSSASNPKIWRSLCEEARTIRDESWRTYQKEESLHLIGLLMGVLADDTLNLEEIDSVYHYVLAQESALDSSISGQILSALSQVMEDGYITESEIDYLFDTFSKVVNPSSDSAQAIVFEGMAFCLTGTFSYGSKSEIETYIEQRGGRVVKSVTKKCRYLVRGTHGDDRYKCGSYGTKVLKAMENQEAGLPIEIINEDSLFI